MPISAERWYAEIDASSDTLAALVDGADLTRTVPTCPEWTLRQLATHVGRAQRWAALITATRSAEPIPFREVPDGRFPDDPAQHAPWLRAGAARVIEAVRDADGDAVWAFDGLHPASFWGRRMAHETAVHRADAEAATGPVTPFEADFAQDGIGELVQGFAARRSNTIDTAAVVALVPSDGSTPWQVQLGGERIAAEPVDSAPPDADVTVAGTASDLYLWLWNRPSAATVSGDERIAALWAKTVRVRWG
jgi:uncharacterized protein (TIGR03083 family)